jgi:hypothetical protein
VCKPPESEVLRLLHAEWDGSKAGAERAAKKIGRMLRGAVHVEPDPRQMNWIEEVARGQ